MVNDRSSKARRVKNELMFKQLNIQVKRAAENLLKPELRHSYPLQFYCECSDKTCIERISVTPEEYQKRHQSGRNFMVLPGHDQPDIEEVVADHGRYVVAQKDKELLEQALN